MGVRKRPNCREARNYDDRTQSRGSVEALKALLRCFYQHETWELTFSHSAGTDGGHREFPKYRKNPYNGEEESER